MTHSAMLFYAVVGGALAMCLVVLAARLITKALYCIIGKLYSLREMCRAAYGDEFVENVYDKMNMGVPVGDLRQTVAYLDMIERVREKREAAIDRAVKRRKRNHESK